MPMYNSGHGFRRSHSTNLPDKKKFLSRQLLAQTLMKKSVSFPSLRKKCHKCNKICLDQKALNRHMKIHNCSTYFLCHKCNKRMSIQRDMCVHACVHDTPVQPHSCTCGRQFSTRKVLEEHVYHHSSGRTPFTCLCGEVFQQQFIIKTGNKSSFPHASDIGKIFGSITLTMLSAKIPKYKKKQNNKDSTKKQYPETIPPLLNKILPSLNPKTNIKSLKFKNRNFHTHIGINASKLYKRKKLDKIKISKKKTRQQIYSQKMNSSLKRRGGGFAL